MCNVSYEGLFLHLEAITGSNVKVDTWFPQNNCLHQGPMESDIKLKKDTFSIYPKTQCMEAFDSWKLNLIRTSD